MTSRTKFLAALGALVSLGVAASLLWSAAPEMSYFVPPSKVGAGEAAGAAPLRVGGTVKPGSVRPGAVDKPAKLVLTDGVADLAVEYAGTLPAMLREGQEAVAQGRLVDGVLQAERVLPRFDDPLRTPAKP